jgi:hypothetical protein
MEETKRKPLEGGRSRILIAGTPSHFEPPLAVASRSPQSSYTLAHGLPRERRQSGVVEVEGSLRWEVH